MTDKEFCKLDTEFYGEEVDHIKQITKRTFNGEELKEYVEHCIKVHLINVPVLSQRSELLAFRKWQKDNWKDIYLYSDEFMISLFLKKLIVANV